MHWGSIVERNDGGYGSIRDIVIPSVVVGEVVVAQRSAAPVRATSPVASEHQEPSRLVGAQLAQIGYYFFAAVRVIHRRPGLVLRVRARSELDSRDAATRDRPSHRIYFQASSAHSRILDRGIPQCGRAGAHRGRGGRIAERAFEPVVGGLGVCQVYRPFDAFDCRIVERQFPPGAQLSVLVDFVFIDTKSRRLPLDAGGTEAFATSSGVRQWWHAGKLRSDEPAVCAVAHAR